MEYLIFVTAFLMEIIGSYISVVGLGSLFSGDLVILTMAVILDVAKVVSVSFLYQYWYNVKSLMRYYMLVAVIVLMTITSGGAFGYLSGAFQKALQPNMEVMLKVDSYKHERDQLIQERDQLTKQRVDIDKQVAQLPAESVKGRRQLINSFKPETERIASRLQIINPKIDELNATVLKTEGENIDKQVHVGPITYVSKAFGISVEDASKWIILTIIFVFDPLAVILIVAGNFLVKFKREHHVPKVAPVEELDSQDDVIDRLSMNFIPHDDEPKLEFPVLDDEIEATPELLELAQKVADAESTISDEEWVEKMSEVLAAPEIEYDDPEIIDLIGKVYASPDTGEEDDLAVDDGESSLQQVVENYIPTVPEIEIEGEVTYSGSPQAELIEEVPASSLEALRVTLPEALFREGVKTVSTKRSLYE